MLIITNRKINEANFKGGIGDHDAFGDGVNSKGSNEVRLATANKVADKWQVKLIKEPKVITASNIPSRKQFLKLRKKLIEDNQNCVFFVHGFNQSFEKNLEKSLALEQQHGVAVIAFSWPSKPGGFVTTEYSDAKRAATASMAALDSTLEKLGRYLKQPFNRQALEDCNIKFSLIAHSLGNYLFKNYIVDPAYQNETALFDNVVLCQADVDNEDHASWVDLIETGKRVYVTINENDWALKWSELHAQRDRLGRTAKNLNSSNALYFDFTDGVGVDNTHGVFYKQTNAVVKKFFSKVLNGKRGDDLQGMSYHRPSNSYRFPPKKPGKSGRR